MVLFQRVFFSLQGANLGKFITPYAAVLHDIKAFLSNGGDVAVAVSVVLTRVDGREVRHVWAMLPHLVVEVQMSQSDLGQIKFELT